MILPSANWLRTSCTTTPAVRETARMARAENKKLTDPPMSRPMNTFGSATLIGIASKTPRAVLFNSLTTSGPSVSLAAVSM